MCSRMGIQNNGCVGVFAPQSGNSGDFGEDRTSSLNGYVMGYLNFRDAG